MSIRFRLYEIEHGGDVDSSCADLRQAGCRNIEVLSTDYEGEESMVVACDLPEGMTRPTELKLEFACL
jgi:hypothetical protein